MKQIMEFDKRILKEKLFFLILLVWQIINSFLWLLSSVRELQISIAWSVSFLVILLVLQWYELLFQMEDGRLVSIYEKIKYFPVDRRGYWLSKLCLLGKTTIIHLVVSVICGCVGSIL